MDEKKQMTLRDRQKMETREEIQRVARSLITEYGYEKTTMRAIAKAAGVGVGTVSLHFKDKKSLLLASFYDEIGKVLFQALGRTPQDVSLREQLLFLLREVYEYYSTHTLFLRSVLKEALFTRGEWREKFDSQLFESMKLVAGLVETAKERGEVKPEVDSFQFAAVGWSIYLFGLINGLNAEHFDAGFQVEQVGPMLDVVLNGVLV